METRPQQMLLPRDMGCCHSCIGWSERRGRRLLLRGSLGSQVRVPRRRAGNLARQLVFISRRFQASSRI